MEEKVHEAVAGEGGRITLGGQVVVRPAGFVGISVTVPVKDPTAVTVTDVAAPVAPVSKFTGVVAEIVKSEVEADVTMAATKTFLETVPTAAITFTL